jgi:Lon protease-like protein
VTALPNAAVPMFPLGRVFLFPHQVLPLHVFEPRYRRMVEDLLDGTGRFVLATIPDGEVETAQRPPAVLPVAGLGEILRHERLPDGRFMIWVLGLARARIAEAPSDRPYRRVTCAEFGETDVGDAERDALVRELRAATTARLREPLALPESAPPSLLTDLLLQTLRAPTHVIATAFAEPSIARRARFVLQQARDLPS